MKLLILTAILAAQRSPDLDPLYTRRDITANVAFSPRL
jgi:hypothetical protein